MSYLVLARKWRPQTFDDVIGQEHITKTLKRGIESDRIAHAYIFTGPRGVGKTTTARILAKALNCRNFDKPTPTPCNQCVSCVEITEGRSPDVTEMDGASHRGIDDARDLQANIQYATVGRYKVIIIDEVHMLTREAFNSLLKTLEEPPDNVIFVFATTEPNAVPLTIISRCQRFDFRLISARRISEQVANIAQTERFTIADEAADFIALRADGSMRDALSMLDQLFAAQPEGEISVETVMKLLGIVPTRSFQKIAQAMGAKNPQDVLNELSILLEGGIDPLQIAKGLVEHFRNALIAKSGALPSDYPNRKLYEIVAQERGIHDLLRILRLLSSRYSSMKRSDTPQYLLEETLIYICLMDEAIDIGKLVAGMNRSSDELPLRSPKSQIQHSNAKSVAKEAISETHHIEVPQAQQQFPDNNLPEEPDKRFLRILGQRRKSFARLLKDTDIILDDRRLLIKFPDTMETVREELVITPESFKLIEDAAKTAFGKEISVELLKESHFKPENQSAAESGIPPKVSEILTLFNAKLES